MQREGKPTPGKGYDVSAISRWYRPPHLPHTPALIWDSFASTGEEETPHPCRSLQTGRKC